MSNGEKYKTVITRNCAHKEWCDNVNHKCLSDACGECFRIWLAMECKEAKRREEAAK